MIILQTHSNHVFTIECEGNSPVSGNGHSPLPFPIPLERMKIHARNVQLLRIARLIQRIKDATNSPGMRRLYAFCIPLSEEPLETLVPKSLNHVAKCNVLLGLMQYQELHISIRIRIPAGNENLGET